MRVPAARRVLSLAVLLAGCGASDGAAPRDGGDTDADSDADFGGDAGADAAANGCSRCCWGDGDPGDLIASGAAEGDTIADVSLIDQCGAPVSLWDFAGQYRVLWITTAW